MEVCTVEDTDDLTIVVVSNPKICYVPEEKSEANAIMQAQAYECALSDYIKCKTNQITTCKFIDCYHTNKNTDLDTTYLFSACVPSEFAPKQIMNICKEVADGNDYRDYLLDDGDPTVSRWKWAHMNVWATVVIVVASLMCLICTLSCYYNYRIFRTGEQPCPVPPCCPDCLFPRVDQQELLQKH